MDEYANDGVAPSLQSRKSGPGIVFISSGDEVNGKDSIGQSPLHKTCRCGAAVEETVRVLVQHGAHPSVSDHRGNYPLHEACKHVSIGVVRCLVENGAIVNVYNDENNRPLHSACRRHAYS